MDLHPANDAFSYCVEKLSGLRWLWPIETHHAKDETFQNDIRLAFTVSATKQIANELRRNPIVFS